MLILSSPTKGNIDTTVRAIITNFLDKGGNSYPNIAELLETIGKNNIFCAVMEGKVSKIVEALNSQEDSKNI
ncbi:MAG: hypothetical protein K1000chlam3_00256 [Chlamydiae bacterium]|nr:hypothetical protein [Chlamydiota bacterium]